MPAVITTYSELQNRIHHWYVGFNANHPVPVKKASITSHWYYSPAFDAFGPSKFIGYCDLEFESYNAHPIDGRETEIAIKKLNKYEVLNDDYPHAQKIKQKLDADLETKGAKVKKNAVLHVPVLNPARRLIIGMNFSRDFYSYKWVFLQALLLHQDNPTLTVEEHFWRFYHNRHNKGVLIEREGSSFLSANLDEFRKGQIRRIVVSPFDAVNNSYKGGLVVELENDEYKLSSEFSMLSPGQKSELEDFVKHRIESYYRNDQVSQQKPDGLSSIFHRFAGQFKANKEKKVSKQAPIFQTLCIEGQSRAEKVLQNAEVEFKALKVNASIGAGNITNYPWLAIFDTRVTNSALKGYYIVFLFADNMSEVYLTLNQGSTQRDGTSQARTTEMVTTALGSVPGFEQGALPPGSLVKQPRGATKNGKAYERTNIYYKRYSLSSLPADEDLEKDLIQLVKSYQSVVTETSQPKEIIAMSFGNFLANKGLLFKPRHVRRFILSLKTKPFVILTGNSGTGKTQLALAYAQYLSQKNVKPLKDEGLANYRDRRWFKLSYRDPGTIALFTGLGVNQVEAIRQVIVSEGVIPLGWLDGDEDDRAENQKKDMRGLKNGDMIIAYGGQFKVGCIGEVIKEPFVDDSGDFYQAFNGGNRNFIGVNWLVTDAVNIKSLRLDGFNKSGFSMWIDTIHRLSDGQVDEFLGFLAAKKVGSSSGEHTSSNLDYVLVPVGADWTDKRHLLGFFNVITGQYHKTETLKLILNACQAAEGNTSTPHFLILDEMNLSHVERYFSDFLSALESRQPIPLHSSEDVAELQGVPEDLYLPNNLYVVGTVNVDETTYMFSPKVLDRANVIEFNTVNARQYLTNGKVSAELHTQLEFPGTPASREIMPVQVFEEMSAVQIGNDQRTKDFATKISWELETFQTVLGTMDFDFGFRVINDVLRYLYQAWEAEGQPKQFNTWHEYFDDQILQKMIPKIHGSQKTLGDGLKSLYGCCFAGKSPDEVNKLKQGESILTLWGRDPSEARYKKSAYKLRKMQQTLEAQRYTSFT